MDSSVAMVPNKSDFKVTPEKLDLNLLRNGGEIINLVLIPAGRNVHSLFCHSDPINVFLGSSRNVASPSGATAAAGSPPSVSREATVCDRQISHGEMSDHGDNSTSPHLDRVSARARL